MADGSKQKKKNQKRKTKPKNLREEQSLRKAQRKTYKSSSDSGNGKSCKDKRCDSNDYNDLIAQDMLEQKTFEAQQLNVEDYVLCNSYRETTKHFVGQICSND